ncbi:MAG: hypothetical protein KAG97_08230 [Victivallales bacterium]|nr:hypothetical protein [Victivallales bacterium]
MDMTNETVTLELREALRVYWDWLVEQRTEKPFFRCFEQNEPRYEWYMIFYSVRTLLHGYELLEDPRYLDAVLPILDAYVSEQLPNGAFTSNFRQCSTEELSKTEFQEILRAGKVNLADNGSNLAGLIKAATCVDSQRKERYLASARRWFDNWAVIWALPNGAYGNGIWNGHKINAPYTMAMCNVATAFAMFYRVTGQNEYRVLAEDCMRFQCSGHWLKDGRPVNLSVYPLPCEYVMEDYARIFYLLEGLCWTHSITEDDELKRLIGKRLQAWLFDESGILSQWQGDWFNFNPTGSLSHPHAWENRVPILGETDEEREKRREHLPTSRLGIRLFWELAKSCGILYCFSYYLRCIEDDQRLRVVMQRGNRFLCTPANARMAGVMSDPTRAYGAFSVQATGFAGLSIVESIHPGSVFSCAGPNGANPECSII